MTSRVKDRIAEAAAALIITGIVSFCTGYFGVIRGQAIAESKMVEQDRRLTKLETDAADRDRSYAESVNRLREEVSALRADTSYIRGKIEARQP